MGLIDIKDTAGAVGAVGKTVIDIGKGIKTLITGKLDPELEAQIEQKWLELENAALAQQNKINEIEAGSASFFVAGWRPAIGWICGFALAFEYIIRPLVQWIVDIARVGQVVALKLPGLDLGLMVPLLAGLLGLGTMRSVEKIKGAQGRH
jgi:hypothetical protein